MRGGWVFASEVARVVAWELGMAVVRTAVASTCLLPLSVPYILLVEVRSLGVPIPLPRLALVQSASVCLPGGPLFFAPLFLTYLMGMQSSGVPLSFTPLSLTYVTSMRLSGVPLPLTPVPLAHVTSISFPLIPLSHNHLTPLSQTHLSPTSLPLTPLSPQNRRSTHSLSTAPPNTRMLRLHLLEKALRLSSPTRPLLAHDRALADPTGRSGVLVDFRPKGLLV